MKKPKHPHKYYAEKYGVTVPTVGRWRKRGIDLDDDAAVKSYMAQKDHGGKPRKGEKSEKVELPAKLSKPLSADAEEKGAAATLARLESAEKEAYVQFQLAIESADIFQIKTAREGWLKLSDSLRRYDLMVEESRREKGALLPKDEVERILKVLAYYIRIAGRQMILGSADRVAALDRPELVAAELEQILGEQIMLGVAALVATSEGDIEIPGWVGDALISDLDTFFRDAKTNLAARAEAIAGAAKVITTKRKNRP